MDFRGLVWKRVWKITFFGLKYGQDLENRAAHPHQDSQGYSPPPGLKVVKRLGWDEKATSLHFRDNQRTTETSEQMNTMSF